MNISFHKLKEILDIAAKRPQGDVASVRRTVILSLLNVIELIFAYAFLYRHFNITNQSARLDGLLYSFKVFTTQGMDGMLLSCFQ